MFVRLLLAALLIFAAPAILVGDEPGIRQMQSEMLYTTVRLRSGGATGSGTIIFSSQRWNQIHTYILTNHHVVSRAIRRSTKTQLDGSRVTTETRQPIDVDIFLPSELGSGFRIETKTATIVSYDKYRDLALLRLDDKETVLPYVARLADENEGLEVFERAFAVGAALGMVPMPTEGRISIASDILSHLPYVVSSTPIIFGNSGGGLYTWDEDHYEVVGVPNKVRVIGLGTVVSHIALSIPMDDVYYFLRSIGLTIIIDGQQAATSNARLIPAFGPGFPATGESEL